MGCCPFRSAKTHPALSEPKTLSSVLPEPSTKDSVVTEHGDNVETALHTADKVAQFEEVVDDDDDDDDEASDDTMPGEPIEAKWARAARRKKKLARQHRRAAKAAKEGGTVKGPPAFIDCFKGIRRPKAQPQKDNCFDRDCFLLSGRGTVDEMYDLSINLGKGTFGTVERCTHRKTKKLRAIKSIPKKKVYQPERLAYEVEIMRTLDHPHILKLFETFEDDKYVYIIMELCAGGELLEKIMNLNGGGLTEGSVATVVKQVVSAVHYMHKQHICHRDLKPENLMLMYDVDDIADAHIKVIDFGFATPFEAGGFMSTRACTNNYVAPEVLAGHYNEACDIWSLGVVIYVLLSGQKPFWGANEAEMLAKTSSCTYDFEDPPCWGEVSDDAKDLIRCILVLDIKIRLTAEQVLQHKWIDLTPQKASGAQVSAEVLSRLAAFGEMRKFSKAAMTAVVQQLQEDSIQQLGQVFKQLDEDNDGCLSMCEVQCGLQRAGIQVSKEAANALECIDTDGSGAFEYTEFLAAAIDEQRCMQDAACWAAFRVFDVDGDGRITKDEMAKMLSCGRVDSLAQSLGSDRAEIEAAVQMADLNGDDCIDFDEFSAFLLQGFKKKL